MDLEALEDWLVAASSPPGSSGSHSSRAQAPTPGLAARQVAQVWGQLRACVQQGVLESPHSEALSILHQYRKLLHVAESQAKLLLSIFLTVQCDNIELLGQARALSALILSAWVRKTFLNTASSPSKQAQETLHLVAEGVCKSLEDRPISEIYLCESILLLGTACTAPQFQDSSREKCQEVILHELLNRKDVIVHADLSIVLAGVGSALAVAHGPILSSLLQGLLALWTSDYGVDALRETECPPLREALMVFHLMEYQGLALTSKDTLVANLCLMVKGISQGTLETSPPAMQCAALMAASGLRRGLDQRRAGNSVTLLEQEVQRIVLSLNTEVVRVCENACRTHEIIKKAPRFSPLSNMSCAELGLRHKQRCIALGVACSRGLPYHPSTLRCLGITLFTDILSLHDVYSAQREDLRRRLLDLPHSGSALGAAMGQLEVHVGGSLFYEVGAIARAMCEQYISADEELQLQTQSTVWEFTQALYRGHRNFIALSDRPLQQEAELLEKVLVSSFMTVLVFFSRAVGDANLGVQEGNLITGEKAALALDCLSCVEFCRRVQMPDYGTLVQRSVSHVAAHQSATMAFVGFLPPYNSIVHWPGPPELACGVYDWSSDGVQTARLSFYLRVLPSCLGKLPEVAFATYVAPTMFLYLQHPDETVAKASHALFASFLASDQPKKLPYRASTSDGAEANLREKLCVYYVERALEDLSSRLCLVKMATYFRPSMHEAALVNILTHCYGDTSGQWWQLVTAIREHWWIVKTAGVTPFDALVYGVAAIANHLPPGSPATIHCIHLVVQKASTLKPMPTNVPDRQTSKAIQGGAQSVDDDLGDSEKLQLLLLHLIRRVDLQVLPELLKQTAQLILGLPPHARTTALENAFEIVAGSSDYMRKPIIVPWLQSLAYLSLHPGILTSHRTRVIQSSSTENKHSPLLQGTSSSISADESAAEAEVGHGSVVLHPSSGSWISKERCTDWLRENYQRLRSSL